MVDLDIVYMMLVLQACRLRVVEDTTQISKKAMCGTIRVLASRPLGSDEQSCEGESQVIVEIPGCWRCQEFGTSVEENHRQ
jgi:hypothetical protein